MGTMQNDLTEQRRSSASLIESYSSKKFGTIAEENQAFELTDSQKRELDRKMELARSDPGQGRSWDGIKVEFMKSR